MRTLIVMILLLLSTPSWSCGCNKLSDAEAFEQATSVVIVQITSTELTEVTEKRAFNYVSAKFRVIQTLKGELDKLKELRSEKGVCEFPLLAGERYIVFSTANDSTDYQLLNACTSSRWLEKSRNNRESTPLFQSEKRRSWDFIKIK